MRKFIFAITLIMITVVSFQSTAVEVGKRVVFMPFYDESGYRGPWYLSYEVPQMIGDMIGGADDYFYVVPMDSIFEVVYQPEEVHFIMKFINLFRNKKKPQRLLRDSEVLSVARKFGGDIAITGVISDFDFRRQGGGEPMIGGYKRYTSKVEVNQVRVLKVSDGSPLGTVRGEKINKAGGMGLELFGKPRQMDLEFLSLDSLDFGSKRFLSTLMGQTTVEALNKVHKGIRIIITKPDSAWYTSKKFKVISLEYGGVFINAGSSDGVSPGDRFTVFTSESGVRVGKINVITVMSDHLSRGEILDGRGEMRPNDIIMPE